MRRVIMLLATLAVALPASGQSIRSGALASGIHFQGYDFDDDIGVEAVNLVMVPLIYQLSVGRNLGFDFYSAYARGAALIGGTEYTLTGLVDSRVRANYNVAPWAVLTLGLSLPTGRTQHDSNEARVAAALSSDLLGFREATFGLGFGATTGLATAYRVGQTGIGAGVSYRFASEFEPRADTTLKYTPGNEVRVRVGLDRNVGSAKFTAGVTYQNFEQDQLDGRDLFQAGNRLRGDVTLSFRTGPGATWTAFLSDVWRDRGDVRLGSLAGDATADSTAAIGRQNMLVGGLVGSWRVRSNLTLQPALEARMLTREDAGGEGWMVTAGTGVPLRFGAFSVTPTARATYGGMQAGADEHYRVLGGEFSLSIVLRP